MPPDMLPKMDVQAFLSRQPAALVVTSARRLMIAVAIPSRHFGLTSNKNSEAYSMIKMLGVV